MTPSTILQSPPTIPSIIQSSNPTIAPINLPSCPSIPSANLLSPPTILPMEHQPFATIQSTESQALPRHITSSVAGKEKKIKKLSATERIGKESVSNVKKFINRQMDRYFDKDVQEQSSINEGTNMYTVRGIKHSTVTEKLSAGQLGVILNAARKDHPSAMGQ